MFWDYKTHLEDLMTLVNSFHRKTIFRFGDKGGEDYCLLKLDNEIDRKIYEYDYHCNAEIINTAMT